jgi:hypothetical protein
MSVHTGCQARWKEQEVGRQVTMDTLNTILLPIVIAVVTYILVDRLGEYKKRRDYSRLGVAIIESLLEEVDTGITIMSRALKAIVKNDYYLNYPTG